MGKSGFKTGECFLPLAYYDGASDAIEHILLQWSINGLYSWKSVGALQFLFGSLLQLDFNGQGWRLEWVRNLFVYISTKLGTILGRHTNLSHDILCRAFEAFLFCLECFNLTLQASTQPRHTIQNGLTFHFPWLGLLYSHFVVAESGGDAVQLGLQLCNNASLKLRHFYGLFSMFAIKTSRLRPSSIICAKTSYVRDRRAVCVSLLYCCLMLDRSADVNKRRLAPWWLCLLRDNFSFW